MREVFHVLSKSEGQTKKLAEIFARETSKLKTKKALVVGLEGELGSGKTTFAKGFAQGLGIKEEIKSPTFILMRVFKIKNRKFFHIDAWRDHFDFRSFLNNPSNILLVEWAERARKFLPKKYFRFVFRSPTSPGNRTSREIIFYAPRHS